MTKQEAQAFVKYNDDIKNHRWASKPQTTQNKSVADIIPNLVAVFIMILNYKSVTKYRHTRYSSLFRVTYADEMYLAAADAILAVNDQLEKQLREIKADHSGRLRLGISVQRSMQILPKVIPVFRQKYPKVTLDLTERGSASLEELLQKGTIDLVFVAMESTGTNLVYEQLIEQETISILDARDTGIVARIESGPPSPWRMWRETFVPMREGHSIRVVQDKLFCRSGFHPKILLETNTLEVGKRVAVASGACMLMSNIYIDEFIRRKRGEFYPLKDYENYRHLYACHSKE